MKPFGRQLIASLVPALAAFGASAAEEVDTVAPEIVRPVTAAYTLELGSSHLVETYLSPIRYNGWHTALDYERWQAMRQRPEALVMRLHGNLSLDRGKNIVGNASMWGAELQLDWTMYRRWRLNGGWTLGAGGGLELEAGCLYNSRNGNNPVSAKGALSIMAAGYVTYSLKVGRLPVTLCYTASVPLTGVFFAPDYGELYYEIYLGDTDGLAHCAWPGNRFDFNSRLTADFHLGGTSVRLGYHLDLFGSSVNHITTRRTTHAAVVGVSGEWMSLSRRHELRQNTKIISALW